MSATAEGPGTRGVDAAWDAIARASPEATFFHSPLWQQLAVAGAGAGTDATFVTTLPDGARAVFPLLAVPGPGWGRHLLSTYGYAFGGPVGERALTPREQRRLYARAGLAAAGVVAVGNPRGARPARPRGWTRTPVETQVLALDGNYPALEKGFSKGHRAAIKQARRKGVEIRRAESIEDYRSYYAVYEDSLRRWGDQAAPAYPWALFETGWRLGREHPDAIRLWLATHEGEIVAGAWVFHWNGHAMYWHAANLESAFELRPANLLLATAIEAACDEGCAQFDFGSSGGHEGTAAFKRRFGASEHHFERMEWVAPPIRLSGRLRARFASIAPGSGR